MTAQPLSTKPVVTLLRMAPIKKGKKVIVTPKTPLNTNKKAPRVSKISALQKMSTDPQNTGLTSSMPIHPPPLIPPPIPLSLTSTGDPITIATLKLLLAENAETVTKSVNVTVHQKFEQQNLKLEQLSNLIQSQNEIIHTLESECRSLQISQQQLASENEYLWKEVLRPNLVFAGIQDDETEDREQTRQKIARVLKSSPGLDFPFDIAYRVGNYVYGKCRPIKVKFLSIDKRDTVWANRHQLRPPIYVNEDLPRMTRRDHAVLRKHKKTIIAHKQSKSIETERR